MQNKVMLGSIVTIIDKELEEEISYRIISGNKEYENDLSADSALGKALIGRTLHDIAIVKADEEYEVEIIAIDNSNIKINSKSVPLLVKGSNQGQTNKLTRNLNKGYGTRAQDIYDECCKKFGWDYSKRYLFGMLQILYAEEATPEKYSPWFLPHNNWTETKGGNWFNKIQGDIIEEMWTKIDNRFYNDNTLRVTFVKNKSKEYIFLGIYKPIKNEMVTLKTSIVKDGKIIKDMGEKVGIKTYQLVCDSYPQ